jgi:TolB-like protein/Tfp pilus assembly protein PilF
VRNSVIAGVVAVRFLRVDHAHSGGEAIYESHLSHHHAANPQRRTVMKLRNCLFTGFMITLLVCGTLAGSPVWGGRMPEPAAAIENMTFPLPNKPSFAVLPFDNTSGKAEPKYICDGLTNSLFDALSNTTGVFVIHPMSTSKYAGKPYTVKQVAEELGVQYVVQGDFKKTGDQVQIEVQMMDALKGTRVWSQSYDHRMNDILKIQDDIALNLVKSAGAKYDDLIVEDCTVEGTNNVEAYVKNVQAFDFTLKGTPEGHRQAKELCQQAIALDSRYLKPYISLVHIWSEEARWGFSDSPEKALQSAHDIARAAINLDKKSSEAHTAMGRALYNMKQHDKAIAALEQAVALNPDNTFAYFFLGWTLCYAGRAPEAIPAFEKMRRSNPLNPQWSLLGLGGANLFAGNYEAAIPYYQKMIEGGSKFYRVYLDVAACQVSLGLQEEARVNCKRVLQFNPKFKMQKHITRLPAKSPEAVKSYTQALQKLDLPQ